MRIEDLPTVIEGQTIKLAGLFDMTKPNVIEGKTFRDCHLIGPANVACRAGKRVWRTESAGLRLGLHQDTRQHQYSYSDDKLQPHRLYVRSSVADDGRQRGAQFQVPG
jgi:hypothetical protein